MQSLKPAFVLRSALACSLIAAATVFLIGSPYRNACSHRESFEKIVAILIGTQRARVKINSFVKKSNWNLPPDDLIDIQKGNGYFAVGKRVVQQDFSKSYTDEYEILWPL